MAIAPPKIDDDFWTGITPVPLTTKITTTTNTLPLGSSFVQPSTPHNSTFRAERIDIYANDFSCHLAKVTLSVSVIEVAHLGLDEEKYIKEKLAYELASYMIKNNLVSFTKMSSPYQNTSDYMARAVLMDKNGVDTIRKMVP